jgi:hypothetical protein
MTTGDGTRTRDIQLGSYPLVFELGVAEYVRWIIRFGVLFAGFE